MVQAPQRPLGSQGLVCSAQDLGCMGMTALYGNFDRATKEEESLRTLSKALELGVLTQRGSTKWIGKAIKQHSRDKFVICTKFGALVTAEGFKVSGKEEVLRSQLAD
ncbi:hypothetical protein AC1031_003238 [Aphanomyces cochlioides]|nr:hypothetical protein AC1031_003238 [Aphanomyces cochlioides]